MKTEITATVRGTYQWPNMSEPKTFDGVLEFTLIPPNEGEAHYGTGCYMDVRRKGESREYVDVRYAGTKDIKKLAKQYIEDRFGDNAKEIVFN